MNNEKRRRALELMKKYYGGIVESESKIVPPELETVSISGTILNFNTDISRPLENLILHLEPTQSGSGDPSPSNIRPISGYDVVNVYRTGKNLIADDKYQTDGNTTTVHFGKGAYDYPVYLKANTYTFSIQYSGARNTYPNLYYMKSGGKNTSLGTIESSKTFTISEDGYYRFWLFANQNTKDPVYPDDVVSFQLEEGTIATDYEVPQIMTYPISFASAGTVYGGSLDVIRGTLTVDRAYALLNDPDKWEARSGTVDFFYNKSYSDRKRYNNSYNGLICSYMVVNSSSPNTARWIGSATDLFGLRWTDGTLDQVKSDAQNNKITIVYELANPITYQLTPTGVTTLLGDNTIWMDAEGTIDAEYWRIKQ